MTQRAEELAFQYYVAESLRLRGENKYLTVRLQELLEPQAVKKKEKTADEIEAEILAEFDRLGVKKKNGGTD